MPSCSPVNLDISHIVRDTRLLCRGTFCNGCGAVFAHRVSLSATEDSVFLLINFTVKGIMHGKKVGGVDAPPECPRIVNS